MAIGSGNRPRLRDLNVPPVGEDDRRAGPVLTKTPLVSTLTAGRETNDDGLRLVARDKATSKVAGSADLHSGAIAAPMTCTRDGSSSR